MTKKHKKIVIGQECITPSGLGRVCWYDEENIRTISYIGNNIEQWRHDQVGLVAINKVSYVYGSNKSPNSRKVTEVRTNASKNVLSYYNKIQIDFANKRGVTRLPCDSGEAHTLINKCIQKGLTEEQLINMTKFVWDTSNDEDRQKWFRYSTLYAVKNAERKIEDMDRSKIFTTENTEKTNRAYKEFGQ